MPNTVLLQYNVTNTVRLPTSDNVGSILAKVVKHWPRCVDHIKYYINSTLVCHSLNQTIYTHSLLTRFCNFKIFSVIFSYTRKFSFCYIKWNLFYIITFLNNSSSRASCFEIGIITCNFLNIIFLIAHQSTTKMCYDRWGS